MYLKYKELSFSIDGDKLTANKLILGRLYKLTFTTPKLTKELGKFLSKLNELPDEFWKPLG